MQLRNTFITIHRRDLTHEERQIVSELHMFLNKKQCDTIKGKTVAGGNKHHTFPKIMPFLQLSAHNLLY